MRVSTWLVRGAVAAAALLLTASAVAPAAVRTMVPAADAGSSGPAVRGPAALPASPARGIGLGGAVRIGVGSLVLSETRGATTRVAEYLPAAGATAGALYRQLGVGSATGAGDPAGIARPTVHAGLRAGLATAAAASYGGCSYAYLGTATTLCPMLHWSNDGRARPQVYFVDHTAGTWPVPAATAAWDQAGTIDLYTTTGGCPAGAHCVNVWAGDYGNTCWQGLATWDYDGAGNFIDGTVSIYLNDYNGTGYCQGRTVTYLKDGAGYRQNVCHEEGHTLGLDHNRGVGSCLNPNINDSASATAPSPDDLALLRWLYSSPH